MGKVNKNMLLDSRCFAKPSTSHTWLGLRPHYLLLSLVTLIHPLPHYCFFNSLPHTYESRIDKISDDMHYVNFLIYGHIFKNRYRDDFMNPKDIFLPSKIFSEHNDRIKDKTDDECFSNSFSFIKL